MGKAMSVYCDKCGAEITLDPYQSICLGKSRSYDLCLKCYDSIAEKLDDVEKEIKEDEEKRNTVLKEITLSNGKVVRVLEAGGYNDGYYWDMSATVDIDGDEYDIQDAGSGSGYNPIFRSMSKNGPCKLTGVELTPVNEDDGDWDYIFDAIKDIAESFFESNAKESFKYWDDTYGNCSIHIDGVKVGTDEEEEKNDRLYYNS